MPLMGLIVPLAFALGAGALCWGLARLGLRALVRGVVLALLILLARAIWEYTEGRGMADLGHLATILLMIVPALLGAVPGLWLGQRARVRHGVVAAPNPP